jgi:hypothetical protein
MAASASSLAAVSAMAASKILSKPAPGPNLRHCCRGKKGNIIMKIPVKHNIADNHETRKLTKIKTYPQHTSWTYSCM